MNQSVVLSRTELDVVWEAERLGARHVALDVDSPGTTFAERADIVDAVWSDLARRELAKGRRLTPYVLDLLGVLARPSVAVDVWQWSNAQVSALAAATAHHGVLGVLDGDECWLIPVRANALAEAAVSVLGDMHAGVGEAQSVPHDVLVSASAAAGDDAHALVGELEDRGVELYVAQEIAGMLLGTVLKGQFGVEHYSPDGRRWTSEHVVAFHDTDAGRYLVQVDTAGDGVDWCTVAPADKRLLIDRVAELIEDG